MWKKLTSTISDIHIGGFEAEFQQAKIDASAGFVFFRHSRVDGRNPVGKFACFSIGFYTWQVCEPRISEPSPGDPCTFQDKTLKALARFFFGFWTFGYVRRNSTRKVLEGIAVVFIENFNLRAVGHANISRHELAKAFRSFRFRY